MATGSQEEGRLDAEAQEVWLGLLRAPKITEEIDSKARTGLAFQSSVIGKG